MRNVDISAWLKGLPLAPEFRPTDTEFADPIAYISKIEKEASAFGICKVIPPLPKPSKKYVFSNLNKSLSKCPELGSDINLPDVGSSCKKDDGVDGNSGLVRAVFTTRHQELGKQSVKKAKEVAQPQPSAVHKQVWQSGEIYTLEQFEAKSKSFARSQLGLVKEVSPLLIEALFWKAASDKPIYIEYANDVPGSGFGDPEGPFRYSHRRRRRKRQTFDRNNRGSSDCQTHQVNTMNSNIVSKDLSSKTDPDSCVEPSMESTCSPSMLPVQSLQFSRSKVSNGGNEMEGTAGWKLSNSPWNLQVIARAPGSLTRFMPDDIPGVTSPMVYIGMLFSWFAWHVEDHELHSLNFLHTGSPKTWYAVPGDYAFTFEEVIRKKAYGGNIDRLAALTLLGEKTTLLSPEVVVASGIPCCRLVQNPGEFVVTFPRAYHVGFSHGFNCGEAANFSTPKWLTVAKEAAVRRAAMNYLPMLSHQQLLYLLTMSFVSRVPRSLLPGVRSSRLRDRQREERELSVKKAFVEDILNENSLLTIILQKNSSFQAVLWDLESMPSSSKDSEFFHSTTTATTPRESSHSENYDNQDLFSQMSLYMETMNDFYVDDDLSCDFQVDSGTLPCVACGILGFPFMSVVQPSDKASMNLLLTDQQIVPDIGVRKPVQYPVPSGLHCIIERSVSGVLDNQDNTVKGKMSSECDGHITTISTENTMREFKLAEDEENSSANAHKCSSAAMPKMKLNESNLVCHPNEASSDAEFGQSMLFPKENQSLVPDHSHSPKNPPGSSKVKFEKGWNISSEYLRPRIFCLEHAIQMEELLHSKGGANMLVICHSDFPKIKAHAVAVAEEIGGPFNYNEIPLANASVEDLNLINLAIDKEEQDECGEDWTSKLSVNLRHCVMVSKKSPYEKLQHALSLDGLFCDTTPSPNSTSFKWQSRKTRSKRNPNRPVHNKPPDTQQIKKDEDLGVKTGGRVARKEVKLIQYSRRGSKYKPCGSAGSSNAHEEPKKLMSEEVPASHFADPDTNGKNSSGNNHSKNTGNSSLVLDALDSSEKDELHPAIEAILTAGDLCKDSVLSPVRGLLSTASSVTDNVETQIGNHMLKETIVKERACDDSMPQAIKVADGSSDNNDKCCSKKSAGSSEVGVQTAEKIATERGGQIVMEIGVTNESSGLVTTEGSRGNFVHTDVHVSVKEVLDHVHSSACADGSAARNFDELIETTAVEKCCGNTDVSDYMMQDDKVLPKIQMINDVDDKPVSSDIILINETAAVLVEENPVVPRETSTAEELHSSSETYSLADDRDMYCTNSTKELRSRARNGRKRKREGEFKLEDLEGFSGFIRSPCEGLRPRAGNDAIKGVTDGSKTVQRIAKIVRKHSDGLVTRNDKKENKKGSHRCDLDGCRMSFHTKAELVLHKRNQCPHEGCRKKFTSHKYAMLHQRVHDDDRPLKCPWKGCTMSFKWAWARTEHLRVHTGERPYKCKVEGCGLTFRFVSDFSRHRRKTGHYVNISN